MSNSKTNLNSTTSITKYLAECIESVRYDTLSEDVLAMAKKIILDGVANMLAGSTQPLGEILTRYVYSMKGIPTATVVGANFKTSPPFAAYANAAFSHSMDYEAMWWPPTHPTSPVLPALFALAEHEGLSGKKIIEALVVGFEVQGRLNLCVDWIKEPYSYFHPPGTIGVMGSAAACSKLLNLDSWETRMAMGIAGSRTGGLWANTGTMTKSQHSANSARSGVECALLARAGYTSNEFIIENKKGGFGQLIFGEGADLEAVIRDFGKPYRMVDPGIAIKKYPSQNTTHWSIDAALELKNRYNLKAVDINQVIIHVGYPNWSAHWPRPRTGLEGKFSIHYTVAVALLDGNVNIDSFTDERRFSPDIEEMLEKISVKEDKSIPKALDFAQTWATIEVTLKNGKIHQARCNRPRGRWDEPLTREELMVKFNDCAQRILCVADSNRVYDLIEGFDKLENISEMMFTLGQSPYTK